MFRRAFSRGARSRISANIQSSVYWATRSEAAANGMSLDDFIVRTLEEAVSWDPEVRAAVFAAGIGRERNETVVHQSISWPRSTQEKVDDARQIDWGDAGLPLLRSRWITLVLDAHLAGGAESAPRKTIVRPYPRSVRQDMLLNPQRYGIALDMSGRVPSKPPRDALTVRINPIESACRTVVLAIVLIIVFGAIRVIRVGIWFPVLLLPAEPTGSSLLMVIVRLAGRGPLVRFLLLEEGQGRGKGGGVDLRGIGLSGRGRACGRLGHVLLLSSSPPAASRPLP